MEKTADGMATGGTANKAAIDSLSKKDYRKAYEAVVKTQKASISHLQRMMGIGYTHAAALIDELELNGVIGPATGPCHRKVLVDTLTFPGMAEIEMTIRMSSDNLKALRRLAKERRCEVDDIVSEFVRERLLNAG